MKLFFFKYAGGGRGRKKKWYFLNVCQIFMCENESTMRWRLWKNTSGWWHSQWNECATSDQVTVCWSLYFNWPPLYVHAYFAIFVLNTDLRKIWFVPDISECNYCVCQGAFLCRFSCNFCIVFQETPWSMVESQCNIYKTFIFTLLLLRMSPEHVMLCNEMV
jgi:hypothetical protein